MNLVTALLQVSEVVFCVGEIKRLASRFQSVV